MDQSQRNQIQNIALMMVCNEEDMIEETMNSMAQCFDHILVIDGSTDKTTDIIRSYDNVVYLLKDEMIFPKRKITDGIRQFILEKAQEMFPIEGWFTLLHGDEIMVDNPNDIIAKADKQGADIVNWHSLNFFLHTTDEGCIDETMSVQDRVRYYQPGGLEIRQFKNTKNIYYKLDQMQVLPHGLKRIPLLDYPILKHYIIRSSQQFNKDFQGFDDTKEYKDQLFKNIYRDYITEQNIVRKYDGSFHELEPHNRPNFFLQYLKFRHYRKGKIY